MDEEGALEIIRRIPLGTTLNSAGPEVASAVNTLVGLSQTNTPITSQDWSGRWHVVYAPHIRTLSNMFSANFDVEYVIDGERAMTSNVKYTHPLLGSGWLSSSGSVGSSDAQTSVVNFDSFWVDPVDTAQPDLKPDLSRGWRRWVNDAGKVGFISDISRFPVLYFKGDVCIFKFPALNVLIATRREQSRQ